MKNEIRRLKHKRWGTAMLRMAADIAIEKGVTVRLEPDGAISVAPNPVTAADADEYEDNGLEKW